MQTGRSHRYRAENNFVGSNCKQADLIDTELKNKNQCVDIVGSTYLLIETVDLNV